MFRARPAPRKQLQPETPDTTDTALATRARSDPAAFSPLYQRYAGPIYRFCFVRLGNRQAAEDATSETFMKALANLDRFHGGSFRAWLFRIAQNVVVDQHRRSRPSVALDLAGNVAGQERTPEEWAVSRSEVERLRNAVQRLPDDQRIVVELGLAGWTGAEIAETVGKSTGNVRVIRYRAMQHLTTLLNPPDNEPREHSDDD